MAFVVADSRARRREPTLEELRAHCRASLADYKAPDRLELLSELPTTPLGKVDTRALRALAARTATTKPRVTTTKEHRITTEATGTTEATTEKPRKPASTRSSRLQTR